MPEESRWYRWAKLILENKWIVVLLLSYSGFNLYEDVKPLVTTSDQQIEVVVEAPPIDYQPQDSDMVEFVSEQMMDVMDKLDQTRIEMAQLNRSFVEYKKQQAIERKKHEGEFH